MHFGSGVNYEVMKMSISCKCLNISIRLENRDVESLSVFGGKPCIGQLQEAPVPEVLLFLKEALGPVRCSSTEIKLSSLLQVTQISDLRVAQCRNCECCVYAELANSDPLFPTYLVNSTLMTNREQLSVRMQDENFSPAFNIIIDRSSLTYSDLKDESKRLNRGSEECGRMLRAYMEQETEIANKEIQRFIEQRLALLKVKRERAEQDYLILAKLTNYVPELSRSNSSTISSKHDVDLQQTAAAAAKTRVLSSDVTSMTVTTPNTASAAASLSGTAVGSQLETPPPTPEYMPMSTGNSPPITTASNTTGQQPTVTSPSSSSSMSTADQSSCSSPSAKLTGSGRSATNRANLSYNNNNDIFSLNNNNNRGAITNSSTNNTPAHRHSSTNMMQQQMITSSFDSDCMFDIDGMENDKSSLSNTFSKEEEYDDDEPCGNNNEDGIYIPSRQLGRQYSSIAKSLPISMPQAMAQFRANEEDFDEVNEDNVDIAASIKALAKSVHGDTVFGDLPRPQIQRFSTQI